MRIAVLSGKGGTGKTTVSLGLFSIISSSTLIDTDIEEPNDHLFLEYCLQSKKSITKGYPVVDTMMCTLCGACGDFCNFNAILPTKQSVLTFGDLCHDCGGCKLVCKNHAIHYELKEIGTTYHTTVNNQEFHYGNLNVGEVSGVRIIHHLKEYTKNDQLVIIDSPPGTSCSTVEAVTDSDYAIIVTEPTPFGFSDMLLVIDMLEDLNIPFGVVINKSGIGKDTTKSYLLKNNIPLLGEVPFKREFAELYSNGRIISDYSQEFKEIMKDIAFKVGIKYV